MGQQRWQRHRMAADFSLDADFEPQDLDPYEAPSSLAVPIVVDGMEIGASYGGDPYEDAEIALLGDGYFRELASAPPDPRAGYVREPIDPVVFGEDYLGASPGALMRHWTQDLPAEQRAGSGGGRGRRRTKPVEVFGGGGSPAGKGLASVAPSQRMVAWITRATVEFYRQRPGVARAVVAQLAAYVQIERQAPEPPQERIVVPRRLRRNFEVWGLSEEQAALARVVRGAADYTLEAYALTHDRQRVLERDGATTTAEAPLAAA